MNIMLNRRQRAAVQLMKNDLRFIYTITKNSAEMQSNYIVSSFPYIGLIIDGVEDWIKAYSNSEKVNYELPMFTENERLYYESMRSSIKMWDNTYDTIYKKLEQLYIESDLHFSGVCKPIAKSLHLYDIFGVDIVDGLYCGNTILNSLYVPQFRFSKIDTNKKLAKACSIIGGKYISLFAATKSYTLKKGMHFAMADFGGLIKSPVGNAFSDKFVLFSLLCQINFILKCVDKYIAEETTTKLRFSYLLYYYVLRILPAVNQKMSLKLHMNNQWYNNNFRNAMAHYKLGVALREEEIVNTDPLYGLTQKFFDCDYITIKRAVLYELDSFSKQLSKYLRIRSN